MPNDNWRKVDIKDVCESVIDCINKTAPSIQEVTPYKMIRTTNVKNGWVDLSQVRYVKKEIYEKWTRRSKPIKGDVILTREAPLGEVGMLRVDDTIFLGQRLVMYRANPKKLDKHFLLYSLMSHEVQGQIKSFGSGSTVEHMRVPDCERIQLGIPSLKIQKKIGRVLSAYDDLIENNTRRIKILEEMAQLIYQEWFVKFKFPGHEKVKMVDSPLGKIPEGWEDIPIVNIPSFRFINEKIKPYKNEKNYFATADINGLDIVNEGLPYKYNERPSRAQKQPIVNSVWFARMKDTYKILCFTEINKEFAENTILSSGFCGFEIESDWLSYFYFTVKSTEFHEKKDIYTTGATQMSLTDEGLKKLSWIIPDSKIVVLYNEICYTVINQILKLQEKNNNLRKTRDLLLPKLISGEIDVEDLDINIGESA